MPLTEEQLKRLGKAYDLTVEALEEFRAAGLSATQSSTMDIQSALSKAKGLLQRLVKD